MEYQVAIPSYRRPETLVKKTLAYLKRTNVDSRRVTVFVANGEEWDDYREALSPETWFLGKLEIGKKGIGQQRNFIERYYDPGTLVFSIDDDIEEVRCRITEKLSRPVIDLDEVISFGFDQCLLRKLNLWGIHPTDNPFFLQNKLTTDLRYIAAGVSGFIATHDPRRLVLLEDKEDFERTIRYYVIDGGVVRLNWLGPLTRCYTEPGGLSETRTRQRVYQSALWLSRRFPDYCRLNLSKRSGWAEVVLKDRRRANVGESRRGGSAKKDPASYSGR